MVVTHMYNVSHTMNNDQRQTQKQVSEMLVTKREKAGHKLGQCGTIRAILTKFHCRQLFNTGVTKYLCLLISAAAASVVSLFTAASGRSRLVTTAPPWLVVTTCTRHNLAHTHSMVRMHALAT